MTQSSLSSCDIPSSKEASVSRRYDVFSRFIVGMPKTKDTKKHQIKELTRNQSVGQLAGRSVGESVSQ